MIPAAAELNSSPAAAPPHHPTPPNPNRLHELDALRGIASVTVVLHHWVWIFPNNQVPFLLMPFLAGHEAVILFFVLSGYVLSLPLSPTRTQPYVAFVIRRLGRIYLPFIAAAAISALCCVLFFGRTLPLADWYFATWHQPITFGLIARELVMSPTVALNPTFWSLSYEMSISLCFPLLWSFLLGQRRLWGWATLIAVKALEIFLMHRGLGETYPALALRYLVYFLLGAAVARDRHRLLHYVRTAPRLLPWAAFVVSLAAYLNLWFSHFQVRRADQLVAVGAAGLILVVQDRRLTLGLHTRLAQFLGRISYSLYLLHAAVLLALFDLFYQRISTWALAGIFAVTCIVVTVLFCFFIEEPAHRLGKRLSRRVQPVSLPASVTAA